MIDYSKGLIYYIVNEDTEDLYIGSTTNLQSRKYVHKNRCHDKNSEYYDDLLYSTIRGKGGWDAWDIGVLKPYPCASRDDLQRFERILIKQLNANLNSSLPTTGKKKYKEL